MELTTRTTANPSMPHLIAHSKNTTRLKMTRKRASPSTRTMATPQLLRRPQLPSITITSPERIDEESSTRSSRPSDVLRLLDVLQLPVDADTYSSLIKECIDSRDAVEGAKIHAHIQRTRGSTRITRRHSILTDRLLLMYAACGRLEDARELFDQMPVRDVISRVIMVAALSHGGDHVEAAQLFVEMHESGCARGSALFFDAVMAILGSCARAGDLHLGQQVHGLTLKLVGSSACAHVARSLVRLYCRKDQFDRAFLAFREMRRLAGNKKRNCHSSSFQSVLRACGSVGDEGWSGMQVHADTIKTGLDRDPFVGSGLVRMYGKCGQLGYARTVFDVIDSGLRDTVCWNAMLASILGQQGCSTLELLRFIGEMRAAGMEPQESMLNEVMITLVLET
ncbi:hypothetical protein J5N97_008754 [Dioscorea zingiberensis]|uniref:Pentatricopeptide repeat-containing protein n=1 Tax=Dioscorea zingiberensis TaxID=325984 RepID=A0A9D5CWR4_9LILI|nr:hypothetical protein J5N97_008754 [Dioscorea zingiberensis]